MVTVKLVKAVTHTDSQGHVWDLPVGMVLECELCGVAVNTAFGALWPDEYVIVDLTP